ncbi:MAG TPA: 2TM domain-containing protein [Candidatus Anoxymicrobiaceae bacterium]
MADEATQTEDEIRQRAEKRVRERVHLLQHIAAYVIINGFLVVIWALTTGVHSYPWFIWVMVGWGVGLLFNIVSYFTGRKGSAAHDRMIDKEMERLKKGA